MNDSGFLPLVSHSRSWKSDDTLADYELIVAEILISLPVKSLMRFKCVCKNWQSLIQNDEHFIDLHHTRSQTHNGLLISPPSMYTYGQSCSLLAELLVLDEGGGATVHKKIPDIIDRRASFLQPLNGLFCFIDSKEKARNKIKIVDAGALEPLVCFLRSNSTTLREYATAALLTLSVSAINKPTISSSGAIPLLVEILRDGSPQAKVDSVMTLYNLSTRKENLTVILSENAISPLVNLLKSCKKSSKTTEKCSALIESLLDFDEGRSALTSEEGGVLAVVEVLENGSPQSRECAVGALLKMCESDRDRYREPILKEGVIPGLLELTVQGTPRSQAKARTLLQLLRDSPYPRSEFEADTLENIVCDIVSQIDGEDRGGKAKKMLAEMVQVSMEQSLRHLQQRALVCTPTEMPLTKCRSKVSSK